MNASLDRGSAPVEFVFVSILLVALVLAVLQVAFITHVRAVAIDSAIAGAARAALADSTDAEGLTRTRELIALGVAADLVRGVRATSSTIEGRPVARMEVDLAVPAFGPFLDVTTMTVSGRAYREIVLTSR